MGQAWWVKVMKFFLSATNGTQLLGVDPARNSVASLSKPLSSTGATNARARSNTQSRPPLILRGAIFVARCLIPQQKGLIRLQVMSVLDNGMDHAVPGSSVLDPSSRFARTHPPMLQGSSRDKAKLIYILKAEGKASCDPEMFFQAFFCTVLLPGREENPTLQACQPKGHGTQLV